MRSNSEKTDEKFFNIDTAKPPDVIFHIRGPECQRHVKVSTIILLRVQHANNLWQCNLVAVIVVCGVAGAVVVYGSAANLRQQISPVGVAIGVVLAGGRAAGGLSLGENVTCCIVSISIGVGNVRVAVPQGSVYHNNIMSTAPWGWRIV